MEVIQYLPNKYALVIKDGMQHPFDNFQKITHGLILKVGNIDTSVIYSPHDAEFYKAWRELQCKS